MKRAIFNIRQMSGKLLQKHGYVFCLSYPKRVLFAIAKEENEINSSVRWVVSEMSTGLAVAFGKWDDTRKATITKAPTALRKIGAKALFLQIKETIQKHGKAN